MSETIFIASHCGGRHHMIMPNTTICPKSAFTMMFPVHNLFTKIKVWHGNIQKGCLFLTRTQICSQHIRLSLTSPNHICIMRSMLFYTIIIKPNIRDSYASATATIPDTTDSEITLTCPVWALPAENPANNRTIGWVGNTIDAAQQCPSGLSLILNGNNVENNTSSFLSDQSPL